MAHPTLELIIGGKDAHLSPETDLIRSQIDPQSGRTILFLPVVINDKPTAGKPYTNWQGDTIIPSVVGKTTIKECAFEIPTLPGCTISGFASLQISGLSPKEVCRRWSDREAMAEDGTHLIFDETTREYKVINVDSTDDISTTGNFTPSLPHTTQDAKDMSAPFNGGQLPAPVVQMSASKLCTAISEYAASLK